VNTPTSYDTLTYGKLYKDANLPAFMLTADKFDAQYNLKTSAPEDYTLEVSLSGEGSLEVEKKTIKVNSPLTIGNTRNLFTS
jgi:cytochrome c biogenesis protein